MTLVKRSDPSVAHALLANAERGADAPTITIAQTPDQHIVLRHDAMAQQALRVAAVLAESGVGPGDRVVLCLPTSPEFATIFFAITMLRAVPAAIALPTGFGDSAAFVEKIRGIRSYLTPKAFITTATIIEVIPELGGEHLSILEATSLCSSAEGVEPITLPTPPDPSELCFLQLTSGSTGEPKAVMVTHDNVMANCQQVARACSWSTTDVQVAWLPLNHDMGLIGTLLAPIYLGTDSVLMSPDRFLRKPAEWLKNASRYNGTLSATTNFGLNYAAARIRDEELVDVDLSSWRFIFCGAEPIDTSIMRRFVERFAPWGMRRDAVVPCYGLAEATLAVAVSTPVYPAMADTVCRERLSRDQAVVGAEHGDPTAQQIVSCGPPVWRTEVRIVDENGCAVTNLILGAVEFRGPSQTPGYYLRPEATAACQSAEGWWKTGDLGYLRDGELYVVGRAKDLLIIRGANHLPTDFERAAETVEEVRPGGVVAVGVYQQELGTEELHLVVETRSDDLPEDQQADELRRVITATVSQHTGVAPTRVHLVPRRGIPKTTSGKPRRFQVRQHVENTLTAASRRYP